MSTRIAIIDYGMGNLLSVRNALVAAGAEVTVAQRGEGLSDAHAIVLPGVGAFGKGMEGLHRSGFVEALEVEVREKGKPMLGICLGLQLLATRGTELGEHKGLGWVRGHVVRFELDASLRVPHVGWNDVHGGGALFAGLPEGASFYFVHSYHLVPEDESVIAGRTDYGGTFVSAIASANVYGVQFHPEKSHKHGLELLRRFVKIASAEC
jgi:glutamine amidotransferase